MKEGREEERAKEGREGNREGENTKCLTFLSGRYHQPLNVKTINNFKQMLNTLVPCSKKLLAAGSSVTPGELKTKPKPNLGLDFNRHTEAWEQPLGQQTAPSFSKVAWSLSPGLGSCLDRDFPKG